VVGNYRSGPESSPNSGTIARGQFMWGTDPVKSKQECLIIYNYFVCASTYRQIPSTKSPYTNILVCLIVEEISFDKIPERRFPTQTQPKMVKKVVLVALRENLTRDRHCQIYVDSLSSHVQTMKSETYQGKRFTTLFSLWDQSQFSVSLPKN
jgi:hypothetical protein